MTDKMNDFGDSPTYDINSASVPISAGEGDSEDEIQISLAPYIQNYLAQNNSSRSCGCLPVPFERAAPHSWMIPCFDSDVLEKQFKISSLKQYTKRFRFALIYMMIISAAWLIFLLCQPNPETIRFEFVVRVLCQVCVHVIGFHILVMTHVGQRLLVQKQLEMEKRLKEKIIHSVMPPKVAGWLLGGERGENPRPSNHEDFGSLFRPFNMNRMDNVSILFADIVGFTRMSSNKTAEEIVDILNDLFERFDDLCLANGCEKISTLGDCYYCVSGCPEPRPDHASCCVEMGLDMIDAIQEFDIDRGEDVNMRVGVHTGTVLCGIVGTRRFKFDVWSNDVTFANKLESTGQPGRVHISESTAKFLQDTYVLENYEDLQGTKTYLIKSRTSVVTQEPRAVDPQQQAHFNRNRKSINFSHSPSKRSHYLSLITEARLKFTSLPNVLGSSRTLTGSLEKLNYSQWFSFSKLRNNSSSEMSPRSKHPSQRNLVLQQGDVSISKASISKVDVPLRRDLRNEEEISLCPSVNNRSPVNRNSNRRSSIQQQIYLLNGVNKGDEVAKKIGSYYNTSRSTLAPLDSESENEGVKKTNPENLNLGLYSLRKQSDLQLIKCINDISQNSYIVKVPLDQFTLFFNDKKTEKEYRANAHKIHEKKGDSPTTLSTSRFNTYFDIFVSGLILTCITISLYVLHEPTRYFIWISTAALLLESVALILCLVHLTKTASNKITEKNKFFGKRIFNLFSKWYPWHIFGGLLVSLPTVVILTNLVCHYVQREQNTLEKSFTFDFLSSEENKKLILNVELRDHYYTLLILIGLLHFCNFAQLNFFMKSFLALITGLIYLMLFGKPNCQYGNTSNLSVIFISQFIQRNIFLNKMQYVEGNAFFCSQQLKNILNHLSGDVFDLTNYYNLGVQFLDVYYWNGTDSDSLYYATDDGINFVKNLNETMSTMSKEVWLNNVLQNINHHVLMAYFSETVLDIFVIIFLVVLLNRQFEISYRLSYYCNTESSRDKMRVQNMKNQADWLLENIIPKHVSIELKNRAKYCENHSNVGIMFASLVNFNKLYDESYSGGKEYLRVLNELISDFDELLNMEKFKNVDKIKTIGSTFMAASGLNPALRKENTTEWDHIYELMNFAMEMYRVVDVFNSDLLGFNLVLRVGFNIGEVTAGVIGSSKLFYDIWGDAVNVASRMDSCGVDGRIQVPHSCTSILSGKYNLEPRGQVYIKGKGDILVYLVS
ncbi:hypothetical protein RUM43_014427 [Polyplax serrata]|uniref:Adenylate cyclase type 9 n=1 Tax=Polyplax serrata TaxID=468196 RepID=A0AAN8NVJ2_POLSC